MDRVIVKIARDFSRTPGPRYIKEGKWSGELFRTEKFFQIFADAIANNQTVVVDLDGTLGYGTSFLEEIFGGLIREHHLDYNAILQHLEIISEEEPYLKDDILTYLKDAHEESLVHGG
ncbi:MAG: STAS-like domain-containing protein [Bacteroidetes bacterium]|nr:STAS-like domain-containing protein [Bacteroidota bacterium]